MTPPNYPIPLVPERLEIHPVTRISGLEAARAIRLDPTGLKS
jgi:hypothetical protein